MSVSRQPLRILMSSRVLIGRFCREFACIPIYYLPRSKTSPHSQVLAIEKKEPELEAIPNISAMDAFSEVGFPTLCLIVEVVS